MDRSDSCVALSCGPLTTVHLHARMLLLFSCRKPRQLRPLRLQGGFEFPPCFHLRSTLADALSFCRYTPCIRAANTFARRKAKGDSDEEAKGAQEKSRLVSRRRHFARLEELRAQFEGFATVCLDGPFDMKDHPCLVHHRSPRTSSPRVRTCKTASVGGEHRKSVPFCNTILTSSGALGYVSPKGLPKDRNEYGLCTSTLPRPESGAPFTARTLQTDMLRFPSAFDDELASDLQAHSLAACHRAEWFVLPASAGTPGIEAPRTPRTLPPIPSGGPPRSPVISIGKIEPVPQVRNSQLKAHVLEQFRTGMVSKPPAIAGCPSAASARPGSQGATWGVKNELGRRREQFLRRALHYLGVPYRVGAKAHPDQKVGPAAESQPELYLDCCALIRRCLLDLKSTLGFEVGPYNQAYLYDTLPVAISEEQLCPGDLIFVQGKHKDKTKSSPKHGIVHVEIFLGGDSGRSSLGAKQYIYIYIASFMLIETGACLCCRTICYVII
jgi:cell wall-associated NlpC family hydrolase